MNISKILLCSGVVVLVAAVSFFLGRSSQIASNPTVEQQPTQSGVVSAQYATCLAAADSHYEDAWNNLCSTDGKAAGCKEFVGSPKDIELTKVKDQEKQTCASLYK